MTHHFNIEVAKRYGITEAILIENLYFWTQKNKTDDIQQKEGRSWAYCPVSRMAELFPYLSERQIKLAIKRLSEEYNVLLRTHFPHIPNNKTFYALSDEILAIYEKDDEPKQQEQPEKKAKPTIKKQPKNKKDLVQNVPSTPPYLVQLVPSTQYKMYQELSTNCTKYLVQNVPTTWYKMYQAILDSKSKIVEVNSKKKIERVSTPVSNGNARPEKIYTELTEKEFAAQVMQFRGRWPDENLNQFFKHFKQKNPEGKMLFQTKVVWDLEVQLERWMKRENHLYTPKNGQTNGHSKNGQSAANGTKQSGTSILINRLQTRNTGES